MIVDPSALIAILRNEPDRDLYLQALTDSESTSMSAASLVEAAIVVDAVGDPVLSRRYDDLLTTSAIRIEPVTEQQAPIARQGYRDYGRGSSHPARLNFGDCFLLRARPARDEPLRFKGDDFVHSDLRPAIPRH